MTTNSETDREAALVERLFEGTIATLELYGVYLGERLGLYRELAADDATPAELASRTGIDERYAREWLEQQAVAGMLDVEDASAPPDARRYHLPAAHAGVLADPDSTSFVTPFAPMLVAIAGALPDVAEAYRSGGGVPFSAYGEDMRRGQGGINRPAFTLDLPGSWLPAIADLHAHLSSHPSARIADLGCGEGWSTLALARAYPGATVHGFDTDHASVTAARESAGAGFGERLAFEVRDAAGLAEAGPYDLVCIFEALHDMARPVEVLEGARAALAPGGSVLVVDERVADEFTAPGDAIERMMYGWSITHCLPASMVEQPSAATGTVMRAGTLRDYAAQAGLDRVEVVPVDNDLFRFYRLRIAEE